MATKDDEALRAEVNRLYWRSDESVGRIADKLGISRRALYNALRPHPTGEPCPDCGEMLVHVTRTAMTAGEVECEECGLESDLALLRQATADAGSAMRERAEATRQQRSATANESGTRAAEPESRQAGGTSEDTADREVGIVVAAIAGAVIGSAAALLLTRR